MSRRKQAKPRAFLKAGEKSSNCDEQLQHVDTKEELEELYGSDIDSQDEEDECKPLNTEQSKEPQRQHTHMAGGPSNSPRDQSGSVVMLSPLDNAVNTEILAEHSNGSSNKEGEHGTEDERKTLEDNEFEDDFDEDDEIADEGEDDIHSLDSFYSDMYSTHTSSSYSPSISDGTITPNSVLHLPQPHHLQSMQNLQLLNNEDNTLCRNDAKTNGAEGVEGAGGNTVRLELNKNHCAAFRKNHPNAASSLNEEQLKRQSRHHREHAMKISTKLRKIDRNGAKFDKLTGDGIKSSADGSYQCQFCDKSFPRLGYLKKHEQSHAEHLPFKCDYCARLFKHKRSRDRHTKLHTGDRRYRCPHCEAAFSRSDHLKIHMKTHDNQKPFQCTICNRGYNTAAALTSHMQNHKKQAAILAAGGSQALNYSPRSTGSASSNGSLYRRRYGMAPASEGSPNRLDYPKRIRSAFFSCSYCTKSDFSSMDQLNMHIQTKHEKELLGSKTFSGGATADTNSFQLACEYCTMKFPNIPAMFQHMRSTHIDRLTSPNSYFEHFNRLAAAGTFSPRLLSSKPSVIVPSGACLIKEEHTAQSPKSSDTKQEEEPTDLSQNKRRSITPTPAPYESTNSSDNPGIFFCNQCNAGLPDFESFRNHLKSHIAQGLQLVCHHCGVSMSDQTELERHIISHFLITNSEFKCSGNCSKSFTKPDELQKHLLEQHSVTIFKCELCSETFDSKVAIQVHFACTHCPETKLLRCSACMEVFQSEAEFNVHVKTRHQATNGRSAASASLQCMFCHTVCSSDLQMQFHLAAHARQFRCPSCPETFHVEFLLDRHMQSHQGSSNERVQQNNESNFEEHAKPTSSNAISPINSLYVNALLGKAPLLAVGAAQNNNNSILDYNVAFAAHLNKGLFPASASKFYSPLQVDTNAMSMKHPSVMYGLSQRYFDTNRTLMDMYAQHQQDKAAADNYFLSPKHAATLQGQPESQGRSQSEVCSSPRMGFSCDICERNDFRTEGEVHSHRKIVHNMKTGVSLRCAYCLGNFKSRSELEHHMKTCHNSTGKHKCLICDEIFPSPAILAEHKLQHSKVGQSGKCSHCAKPLNDVAAYKAHLADHNNESQIPVQCICCRQSLHSDFEIGLHAKFHTKTSNTPESFCALCLEPIPNAGSDVKVCEKCCHKHNLSSKYKTREGCERSSRAESRPYVENRCNLCKMILPHPQKLQEHLVEHTFAGCEERGFICYICSAVFTVPSGLLNHMTEHGLNARPYDCSLCTEKFFFRAELDHHMLEHEMRNSEPNKKCSHSDDQQKSEKQCNSRGLPLPEIKKEVFQSDDKSTHGDDDEYIEVEQVAENSQTQSHCGQQQEQEKRAIQKEGNSSDRKESRSGSRDV